MSNPLSVVLDVSAVPAQPGGAARYTVELARGLGERDQTTLTLLARRGDTARWLQRSSGWDVVRAVVPATRPARLAFEQVRLPGLVGTLGADVYHGPHYTMPERSRLPRVVTIHDCTFFDHPEWHVRSKSAFFRRAIRRAARLADHLVCVSAITATRLQASCDVRAPVTVIPHGVDHARFRPDEEEPGRDAALLAAAGVPAGRPLVVFVGTIEPRKGVAALVAAFDRVADGSPDPILVLGGQVGWGVADTERALARARHADRIVRTGYLHEDTVPALLRAASVVAYPAIEEGFGLPALEALACGAPLVTTAGTAMAEVAQGAALLVPPADDGALSDALAAVLAQARTAVADQQRARGLAVAAGFTWAASVDAHVGVYAAARDAWQ
jgi:glycosyltransferase involved in cell wall biosynthesis